MAGSLMGLHAQVAVANRARQRSEETQEDPPPSPLRKIEAFAGSIASILSAPQEMGNEAIASLTSGLSAIYPNFPAATIGSPYIGIPHAHAHPPSLIPPAPPIPLPSIGGVLLGTCVQVLIGGLPAARAGDIGLAPTCCGFAPFFTILLGSSKVFIGGTRAARAVDVCVACTKTPGSFSKVSKAMAAVGAVARGVAKVAEVAGVAGQVAGIAADAQEAAEAEDPAVAQALALHAAMSAAQMAADAAAGAASATMGTDPAIPPGMPGAIVAGVPSVLIGGFPVPNTPDPFSWLGQKLKRPKKQKHGQGDDNEVGGQTCKC
jgi:uncharacterized Zn-binding protein involved in type VI secretion